MRGHAVDGHGVLPQIGMTVFVISRARFNKFTVTVTVTTVLTRIPAAVACRRNTDTVLKLG